MNWNARPLAALAATAFAGLLLAAPSARADSGDPILQANGIRYACAGIGKVSREDPRWKQFHVKLEFAAMNVRWYDHAYGSIVWAILALHTLHLVTDVFDTGVLATLSFVKEFDGRKFSDVADNALFPFDVEFDKLLVVEHRDSGLAVVHVHNYFFWHV